MCISRLFCGTLTFLEFNGRKYARIKLQVTEYMCLHCRTVFYETNPFKAGQSDYDVYRSGSHYFFLNYMFQFLCFGCERCGHQYPSKSSNSLPKQFEFCQLHNLCYIVQIYSSDYLLCNQHISHILSHISFNPSYAD